MIYNTSVTYMSCQTCQAKIHCEECAKRLEEALQAVEGVHRVRVDMPKQLLEADAALSADDFAELLEEHGLFSDL